MPEYKLGTLIHDGCVYEVYVDRKPTPDDFRQFAVAASTLRPGMAATLDHNYRVVQTYAAPRADEVREIVDQPPVDGWAMFEAVTREYVLTPAPPPNTVRVENNTGHPVEVRVSVPWTPEFTDCGSVPWTPEFTDCGFVAPPPLPDGDAPHVVGEG